MYIGQRDRRAALVENPYSALDAEELAFVLTTIILDYLPADPNFMDYSSVAGALEIVKTEFLSQGAGTYLQQQEELNTGLGYEDLPQNKK